MPPSASFNSPVPQRPAPARASIAARVERRLIELLVGQLVTGTVPTIAVIAMVLLTAPALANGSWVILVALLRTACLLHTMAWVRTYRTQLAQGIHDPRTSHAIAASGAVSAFVWGASTWPLEIGGSLDFLSFLIVTIALFSVCLAVVSAGYHRPTLVRVALGGALGLLPKIVALTPTIGVLMPLGFAIFMGTVVGYALTVGRQARGGILLHMRRQIMAQRLTRLNQALEAALSRAQWLADRDSLTGLRNRRAFERELATFMDHFAHRKVWLLLLDIDHFKRINDRLGHDTGDGVLLAVGSSLSQWESEGTGRLVGRWGGEEFIAAVALRPREEPRRCAEGLRRMIEVLGDELPWPGELDLSASIGCAMLPAFDAVDAVLEQADTALYQAKDAGRNCCKMAA